MPDVTVRLNIDLPADLHGRLKAACALDGVTIKEQVIRLIEAYLAQK